MSDVKDILNEQEPETGVVRISEDVIEVLTDKAAREIDGVAGLGVNCRSAFKLANKVFCFHIFFSL